MHKYGGIVLDYYDDKGATLKAKYPDVDDLPDTIKTAAIEPDKDRVSDHHFALVALDGGDVMRKFACLDAGTTAMSVIYFMEHGHKLPEDAQKTAATNLAKACLTFDLLPPQQLVKMAEHIEVEGFSAPKLGSDKVVDITGKRPMAKLANPRPTSADDYMLGNKFPIDTWDRVKMAERYVQDNQHLLEPSIRRHCCVKLAAKAESIGYPLDETIKEAGATTFAHPGHIAAMVEIRKTAAADPDQGAYLDELLEKRAQIGPAFFSECLRRFDIDNGLDGRWTHDLPDPWESTFGLQKTAEIIWEQGGDSVTAQALLNLARNRPNLLEGTFADKFEDDFVKDPIGLFKSLPLPEKKLLARMAEDAASDGSSSQHRL
jgi:hypothetical protein